MLRDLRRSGNRLGWNEIRRCAAPGILLGLHFITWIIGARLTPAANSSLIVNMTPVAMPFILLALARERLNRWEIAGTALAMGGVVMLAGGDFRISAASFRGDALCFVSMLIFTLYLALARRNRGAVSLWTYVTPLYFVGGAFCMGVAFIFGSRPQACSVRETMLIVGLAVIPTVIGHSILNSSMRKMRGQIVALFNLAQFFFAGLMAFWLLGELPGATFLPAALLVVSGAVIAIRFGPPQSG
jgi:drug/metabolite transporter (DMT)-like permease